MWTILYVFCLQLDLQEGQGPESINLVLSVPEMSRKGFIVLFFCRGVFNAVSEQAAERRPP